MDENLNWLVKSFLAAFAIAQLLFWKENPLVVLRLVFSVYWLWILPGWLVVRLWTDDPLERLIASIPVSLVLTGLGGYYLGLLGIKIWYSAILVPLFALAAHYIYKRRSP